MAAQRVFFYGTLMAPFNRPVRRVIEDHLVFGGRGHIAAALFDLGTYPAAVPDGHGRVRGEVYEIHQPSTLFETLDEVEDHKPDLPHAGLYRRTLTAVALDDGREVAAWVYFYNGSVDDAQPIASGDYLQYLKER